uniref:Uncharacterized protein n=1 Tax=Oryza meridionalis TaxID=40149 RepID=A0A0E0DJD1_9ORYZ
MWAHITERAAASGVERRPAEVACDTRRPANRRGRARWPASSSSSAAASTVCAPHRRRRHGGRQHPPWLLHRRVRRVTGAGILWPAELSALVGHADAVEAARRGEANVELGLAVDSREYGIGAQVAKFVGLKGYGLAVVGRVPASPHLRRASPLRPSLPSSSPTCPG